MFTAQNISLAALSSMDAAPNSAVANARCLEQQVPILKTPKSVETQVQRVQWTAVSEPSVNTLFKLV